MREATPRTEKNAYTNEREREVKIVSAMVLAACVLTTTTQAHARRTCSEHWEICMDVCDELYRGDPWGLYPCEIGCGIGLDLCVDETESAQIHYWIDRDPRWPGVYYKQVDGQCVHGGSKAGPNCKVSSNIRAGVNYWIDQDPRWPGVYYGQVDGQCVHGGSKAGPNCKVVVLK